MPQIYKHTESHMEVAPPPKNMVPYRKLASLDPSALFFQEKHSTSNSLTVSLIEDTQVISCPVIGWFGQLRLTQF